MAKCREVGWDKAATETRGGDCMGSEIGLESHVLSGIATRRAYEWVTCSKRRRNCTVGGRKLVL
jgi:hypothetical protein